MFKKIFEVIQSSNSEFSGKLLSFLGAGAALVTYLKSVGAAIPTDAEGTGTLIGSLLLFLLGLVAKGGETNEEVVMKSKRRSH